MTGPRFTAAVVTAQVLAQIGTFTLPALLPAFIARWSLSGAEAGWLIGAFFAAYVVAVPVLVALTDRVPARRIYMTGTALTALSHAGFALFADGFWTALALRLLAGAGWAGCYMPGLKVLADRLEGAEQSRAVGLHSMCGYAGGFLGPVIAGFALDAAGPGHLMGWALAFGHIAPVTLLGLWALRRLGRGR
ncbi:MFS transporter [Rhodovarius lipocyclicus]|uniref:MFS transporter n=1 Tax=Rhodovarius lipocyclicus TaxID=268410 RepID=UPI00135AA3B7|nr:MFS transporter [Rhodovarius lipocyclicus]